MSLGDDKKSVLDTIGAYTSLNQNDNAIKQNNSLKSVNNNKEVVPYLLDVLKTVAGTEVLKQLIGGMFSSFIDKTEPKLKVMIKKQFVQYDSDDTLPNSFKNNGVNIPVKNIDVKSKFKTNPNSPNGSLLYDNNKPNFDKVAHQAIINEGTDIPFGNLNVNYNKNTDSFKFKPNLTTNPNPSINKWVSDYIDNTEIINKKELITNVMDQFFGSLTSNQDKTENDIINELEVDKLVEQLVNDNDSFEISNEDMTLIHDSAKKLANGNNNYDMGCGIIESILSFDDFSNLIQNISGSTNEFDIANNIENALFNASTTNDTGVNDNQQTIKDGYFEKIIKIFTVKISHSITTAPQIRMLMGVTSSFRNNGTVILSNAKEDMNKYKTYLKCIIKDLLKLIGEYIFRLAVTYLMKLLVPVTKKIIKEKRNQYTRTLKSLTSSSKTDTLLG